MHLPLVRWVTRSIALVALCVATFVPMGLSATVVSAAPTFMPLVSDWQFLAGGEVPPTQSSCNIVGRRCFTPDAMHQSYNYASLLAAGNEGQGKTIAIVDSFGSDTIRNDLFVFSRQFGLPVPCGADQSSPSTPDGNCAPGISPRFDILNVQGSPPATPPPPNNGPGQEAHNTWALEVSLDVEWAHATAPLANIVLVTTPTAETLGVQGFQQMMNAEQFVVDNHLADVISQSFGSGEGAFHSGNDIKNLRQAFVDAQANNVTVFASSGDGGTTNSLKEPVNNPKTIPYPSVIWPASDPLVTAVGGTYLCTNATTGTSVDSTSSPSNCQASPGVREIGWVNGGGGYSTLFSRPGFQNTLPTGSTFVGSSVGAPGPNVNMRGIPDIAYQASARTGVLVYMTEPSTTSSGTGCGGTNPCDVGWFVVGGTSAGAPQWAGLLALADQIAGRDLGYINSALYQIANNPMQYARDFFDVTLGNNQTSSIPGYSASPGWDAVTGLGSPNVANLISDLIAATS
ncbi:MAG TPA: S53 family peptidase [Ktedonobacteraceae bacterium]|nr:S53 family peptidase [Ktedonobacteraceae bacterium]